jgi:hypothetical protein
VKSKYVTIENCAGTEIIYGTFKYYMYESSTKYDLLFQAIRFCLIRNAKFKSWKSKKNNVGG